MDIQKKMQDLVDQLNHYNHAYYQLNESNVKLFWKNNPTKEQRIDFYRGRNFKS